MLSVECGAKEVRAGLEREEAEARIGYLGEASELARPNGRGRTGEASNGRGEKKECSKLIPLSERATIAQTKQFQFKGFEWARRDGGASWRCEMARRGVE